MARRKKDPAGANRREMKKFAARIETNFTHHQRVFECRFHPEQKEIRNIAAVDCTSAEALRPYALDCVMRLAVVEEACQMKRGELPF